MRAYVDSDVCIWHLRGARQACRFFAALRREHDCDLWIGAMQRAEVVFFMRDAEERDTLHFLSQFQTAALDQDIVDRAAGIYRRWNPSHGIDVNDALLAATVMKTGGRIYTLNAKHYPMPYVLVKRAW